MIARLSQHAKEVLTMLALALSFTCDDLGGFD